MKRRDFLVASAGMSGAVLSKSLFAASRPCPPPGVAVSGGTNVSTGCGVDAAADWLARSTAPGVLWSHNFDSAWEVNKFRWSGGLGNDPMDQGAPGTTVHVANGGPNGYGGALRQWSKVSNGVSLPSSAWVRTFAPLPADGTLPADVGHALFPGTPNYAPSPGSSTASNWMHGFYAPNDVSVRGLPSNSGVVFHGDEFWLSFKLFISTARATATTGDGTGGLEKIFYITDRTGSVNSFQLIFDTNHNRAWFGYNGSTSIYPDGSGSIIKNPQFVETSQQIQTEGPYSACIRPLNWGDVPQSTTACWLWPFGEWVTVVFHIRPGVTSKAGAAPYPWRGVSNGTIEIGVWTPSLGLTDWQWLFKNHEWSFLWQNNIDPNAFGSFLINSVRQATRLNDWYIDFSQIIFSQRPIACPAA